MTHNDPFQRASPADLPLGESIDWDARLRAAVDRARAARQARHVERAAFTTSRRRGLERRHARKLARTRSPEVPAEPRTPTVPGAGKPADLHGREHHAGGLSSLFTGDGKKSRTSHRRNDGAPRESFPPPGAFPTGWPTSFVVGHPAMPSVRSAFPLVALSHKSTHKPCPETPYGSDF